MKNPAENFLLFTVEFIEGGMPDLTNAPGDMIVPIKFHLQKPSALPEGVPDWREWDNQRQGMLLYLMILANYQHALPDPTQPLTVRMADDAMARVCAMEETRDTGPLALRRAMRLAATKQYERAGALWRQHVEEQARVKERERLAELGAKLSDGLQRSRDKAKKAKKDAARHRHDEWKRIGMPLRTARPDMPDNQLAETIAARSGRPESRHAIRKALEALGLKRKKKTPAENVS